MCTKELVHEHSEQLGLCKKKKIKNKAELVMHEFVFCWSSESHLVRKHWAHYLQTSLFPLTSHQWHRPLSAGGFFQWNRRKAMRLSYILISFTSFASYALLFYYSGNESKHKHSWIKAVLIHPWTWTRLYHLALLTGFVCTKNWKMVAIIFVHCFCGAYNLASLCISDRALSQSAS